MTRLSPVRLSLDRLEDRDVPSATVLDLTQRGSQGGVNNALFQQFDAHATGTGAIDSFVRVQAQGNKTVEQGYNTAARSMKVADLPLVNVGGSLYREVLLDINQKASASQLSLDELRVYVGGAGNQSGYDPVTRQLAGLTPVYDLDGAGDAWVRLDARLNSGSGSGDMRFYVPNDLLSGGEYFYLYSKFGQTIAANGGFEEWAAGAVSPPVTGATSFTGCILIMGDEGAGLFPVSGGTLSLRLNGAEVARVDVGFEGQFEFTNLQLPQTGVPYDLVYIDSLGDERAISNSTVTLNAGYNLPVDLHLAP